MPAEFAPHQQTWMLWPERPDNWREQAVPARRAFAAVADAIAQFEPVTVGASPTTYQNARASLPAAVRVLELSCNDSWMRDVGPTFVINRKGTIRGVDWGFNAWGGLAGGLYAPWDLDEQVTEKVLEIERVNRYKAPLIMEGGSFHVDGAGTLLTTAECLLNPNRNSTLTQAEIEQHLKDYLGVQKIIWLNRGVYLDETDGHIDNMACFVRPGVVALTWTDDHTDPQYERSAEAFDFLSRSTDARGQQLVVHKIHQPNPIYITEQESRGIEIVNSTYPRRAGDRLAASYINFYLCNGGLIMPAFDDAQDVTARHALQTLFPDRNVVAVAAREILLGGGNIHCITQQQPGQLSLQV